MVQLRGSDNPGLDVLNQVSIFGLSAVELPYDDMSQLSDQNDEDYPAESLEEEAGKPKQEQGAKLFDRWKSDAVCVTYGDTILQTVSGETRKYNPFTNPYPTARNSGSPLTEQSQDVASEEAQYAREKCQKCPHLEACNNTIYGMTDTEILAGGIRAGLSPYTQKKQKRLNKQLG